MNWERLHHLFEGDEGLIQKFVAVFKAEMPRLADSLVSAAAAGNWDEVSNTAHVMKSQLAYSGFDLLTELALCIEKKAERREDLEGLPALAMELQEGVEGVIGDQ